MISGAFMLAAALMSAGWSISRPDGITWRIKMLAKTKS